MTQRWAWAGVVSTVAVLAGLLLLLWALSPEPIAVSGGYGTTPPAAGSRGGRGTL